MYKIKQHHCLECFPYAGIEKRALDMYIADVEKSNMSSESKLIAILSAKKTIKKLKNQKVLQIKLFLAQKKERLLIRHQVLIWNG